MKTSDLGSGVELEVGETLDAEALGSVLLSLPSHTPVMMQTHMGGDVQSAVVSLEVESLRDGGNIIVLRDYYITGEE